VNNWERRMFYCDTVYVSSSMYKSI